MSDTLHCTADEPERATNQRADDFWGDETSGSESASDGYGKDGYDDPENLEDDGGLTPNSERSVSRPTRSRSSSTSSSSEPDSGDDSEQDLSFPTSVSATPTLIADDIFSSPASLQAVQNLDDVIRSINQALHIKSLPTAPAAPTAAQVQKHLAQRGESVVDALRNSLFEGGAQVLVFPKLGQRVTFLPASLRAALTWKISGFTPKVVRAAVSRANFALVRKGKTWLGCWGKHYTPERFKKVRPWQKVNHFPMSFEIGRKDKLLGNYHRLRAACGPEAFTYLPETYIHPRQKTALLRAFPSHTLWILKPPASARGQGIRVINSVSQLPKKKHPVVVSRYIAKPFLIGGRKFDLRLYVAVTSFEPLRIYLYRDGVVRFAGEKYTSSSKSIRNRYIHLTNYSISRRSKAAASEPSKPGEMDYLLNDPRFSTTANKWSFRVLQDYMAQIGIDFEPVYAQIKDLVTKTIISGHTSNASGVRMYSRSRTSCYELFGFDVLLDSRLKPWLMEVNISPSLKASCDMDFAIKFELVTDLLNLVGFRLEDVRRCKENSSADARKEDKRPASWSERYRQKTFGHGGRAAMLSNLTDEDIKMLQEVEDENHRRGDFERLFPAKNTAHYLTLFNSLSFIDRLLHHWVQMEADDHARVHLLRTIRARDSTSSPQMISASLPDLRKPPLAPVPDWAPSSGASLSPARSTSALGPLRTDRPARAATSLRRTTSLSQNDTKSTMGSRQDSGYVGSQILHPTTYGSFTGPPPPPWKHTSPPISMHILNRSQSCLPRAGRRPTTPSAAAPGEIVKVRHMSLGLDRVASDPSGGEYDDQCEHPRRTNGQEAGVVDGMRTEMQISKQLFQPQGIFPFWPAASRGSSPNLRTRMQKRAHLTASALR